MPPIRFRAEIIDWRGPAPHFFAPIPPEQSETIGREARRVSYGWGVIPVVATIGGTRFTTSLFPKDGIYLLPIKAEVRKRLNITAGDEVDVVMTLGREAGVP